MTNPSPRFTGIFIPSEILEIEELSPLEQILISWIDALYCKDHGGCYASNQYLADRLRVKENTVVKALIKLRKLGLIEDVAFNGRQRVIRARIGEYVEKSQSQADCDLNHRQGVKKITGRVGKKSQAPNIYNSKEERKDKTHPLPPKGGKKRADARSVRAKEPPLPDKVFFGSQKKVRMTIDEYNALCEKYGADNVKAIIEELEDYLLAQGDKYKCHAAAIRQWMRRREKEGKPVGNKGKRRDSDSWGSKNHSGFEFKDVLDCNDYEGKQ